MWQQQLAYSEAHSAAGQPAGAVDAQLGWSTGLSSSRGGGGGGDGGDGGGGGGGGVTHPPVAAGGDSGASASEVVQQLVAMGFPMHRAVQAHVQFGDDLDSMLEYLTSD